jgi:hypothetical protein
MTSPSDVWLGCSIDAGKGKWFVQLVGPGDLFERKVVASAFAVDEENAIVSCLEAAGLNEAAYKGKAATVAPAAPKRAPTGLLTALSALSHEVGQLTDALKPPKLPTRLEMALYSLTREMGLIAWQLRANRMTPAEHATWLNGLAIASRKPEAHHAREAERQRYERIHCGGL